MAGSAKRGAQSLADARRDLVEEWHPDRNGDLTADDVSRSSNRSVWWRCSEGHEWQATVNNRVQGRGCAVCGGKRVLAGFNDLTTVEPAIAAQWHPVRNGDLTPDQVTAGSNRRVWWLCPIAPDHEWQATIANRTSPSVRSGCAVCAGRIVVPSTSLATLFPEVGTEWHPTLNGDLTASDVTPFVTKRVWWQCQQGHEWQIAIAARTRQGTGCPYCSGRRAVPGETDLATLHPELAAEWHPTRNGELTAAEVRPGSNRRVWWRCAAGHEFQGTPNTRVRMNSGCPTCAGQRPIVGITDLATTNPTLAAELHPTRNGDLTAAELMRGSSRRVWWLCHAGHEWCAAVQPRSKGVGCPICANKKVLAGYNDLAASDPQLAAELHPDRNDSDAGRQVTRSSGRKLWWRCHLGHEWQSNVANRTNGQGCPVCAETGFNPARDAWLYLLTHDGWDSQQIGITNTPEVRLATHRRNGWELLDIRGAMPGDHAAAFERDALAALGRRGARLGQRSDTHRFDGYTESWPISSLRIDSIAELIQLVADDDEDREIE